MKKYIPAILVFVFLFSLSTLIVQAQTLGNCTFSGGSVETSYPKQLCADEGGTWSSDSTGSGSGDTTGSGQKIKGSIENPLAGAGVGSIQELLTVILNKIIIPIGGIIAVLAFIYSGFMYVMAQGDPKKIETAHNTLLYTAIGTAILLGSAVIANVITATVNQLK